MKLSISGVTKRFGNLTALDGVSLDIPSGKFVCFLGPSGCGKTTLLRIIAGLDEASDGRIEIDGKDVLSTTAKERNFGIVFQSYSLFPTLTAAQ
ncbi:ATP-binding cassette domain-containing protein, partial [Pseudomonas oryzihabitans]|uniref:ATP-binding cassette domain-containing protein n=1 Tax=Pseudomonas oryzihabitans TaxID=47885 RepID=UPI0028589D4A